MSGKGDTPRPVDKEKYEREFDRIFGKKPANHRHQFCPKCQQPIPGLQAGEICDDCHDS